MAFLPLKVNGFCWLTALQKVQIPLERIFLEPWDPNIWLLYSIYYQNYYVLREDIHSQILKENLKYYEFFGLKSAKWLWKSPNSEKTACHRAFGPWKMDSSLNFTSKSLCFGEKYFSKDLLNINISRKKSLFDIFMKSPNSERTDFCRAMRPKEMDSSLNLRPKSLCFG